MAGAIVDNATVVFNRSDDVTHAGLISGSGQVIKTGTNTLTLTASNTYAGGTIISTGTLQTDNSSGVGSGVVTLGDAGTGSSDVTFLASAAGLTFANDFVVSSSGTGAAVIGTAAGLTGADTRFNGALTLNRAVTLQGGSDNSTTFAGLISGTGDVTVTGLAPTSRVVLAQPTTIVNTFAGNVLVNSGTLQLIGPAANQFIPDASNVTVAPARPCGFPSPRAQRRRDHQRPERGRHRRRTGRRVRGCVHPHRRRRRRHRHLRRSAPGHTTGVLALAKTGTGTQTLTGANTYTGGTVISRGVLQTDNSSGVGSGVVTLGDAGTGSSDVTFLASAAGLTFANDFVVSSSGTGAAVIGTAAGLTGADTRFNGALTLNRAVTLQGGSDNSTTFAGLISGTGDVTVTGLAPTSRVVLAQPTTIVNTFAGNVLVNSGTLQLIGPAANQFIPDASNVTVAPARPCGFPSPRANGAETINGLNGAGTVAAQDGASADVFTLTVGAAGGTGTFDGALQDSATGVLASPRPAPAPRPSPEPTPTPAARSSAAGRYW